MNTYKDVYVISLASILGAKEITNEELSPLLGRSPEEIEKLTGIKSRYHCGAGENFYTLTASAAELAVRRVGMSVAGLHGIFVGADPTGEYMQPNQVSIIADLLGLDNFYNGGSCGSGCSAGLCALQAAANQLMLDSWSGLTRTYLVICGDEISPQMRLEAEEQMLFSDGASCAVVTNNADLVSKSGSFFAIRSMDRSTTTVDMDALYCRFDQRELVHDGKKIFRFATRLMPSILRMLGKSELPGNGVLTPHQPSLRVLQRLTAGVKCRVHTETVVQCGNAGPAGTFMAWDRESQSLEHGTPVFLAAFGEGLTIATAELEFSGVAPPPIPESEVECVRQDIVRRYAQSRWAKL